MSWFVYILRSDKGGKRYFGCTADVAERLARHNRGEVPSTRNRRPFSLLHVESFPTRAEAFAREKFLKSWAGRIELGRILPRT
jgi:putative endonuclease